MFGGRDIRRNTRRRHATHMMHAAIDRTCLCLDVHTNQATSVSTVSAIYRMCELPTCFDK